jgi:hypothetical protein
MASKILNGPYLLLSSLAKGLLEWMLVAFNHMLPPGMIFSFGLLFNPLSLIMVLLASNAALALSQTFINSEVKLFAEGLGVSADRFPFQG